MSKLVNQLISKEKINKVLRNKGILILADFKFDTSKKQIKETLNKLYEVNTNV